MNLTVRTVTEVDESAVESAMEILNIDADLDLESAEGAQYDFVELTDDAGNVVWSTDQNSPEARKFFDAVWS